MHDEAARAARQALGEGGGQDRRSGAREHGVGRGERVEPGEHLALDVDVLRRVLLDVDCAGQRLAEIGDRRACGRARSSAEAPFSRSLATRSGSTPSI